MLVNHLYLENGEINPVLLSNPIIIWGIGNDGRKLIAKLKEKKADILFAVDSSEKKSEHL